MDPPITHQTTTTTTSSGTPIDPTNIIKGKRTKRQRPTNINIITNSSTSYNAFNPSTTSSSDSFNNSTTTEDQDTANCLILLSKGHTIYSMHTNIKNNINNINNNNSNGETLSLGYKFNSKRYIQTSTDDVNGLIGIYVYECKTCSRTFSSFQALGGHRASHKKPRNNNEFDKRKSSPYTGLSDEDEPLLIQPKKNYSSSSSSLSLQLNTLSGNITNKFVSSKVHECSICGAEFNSGQALGGHMRRHRGNISTAVSVADTATNTTLSLIPYGPVITNEVVTEVRDYQKSTDDGLCLDLDLNLPAPQELTVAVCDHDQDQHRESSFKFSANQNKEQTTVHLSTAPTLVDCHY